MRQPNEHYAQADQRKLRLVLELRKSAREADMLPWYRNRLLAAAHDLENFQPQEAPD